MTDQTSRDGATGSERTAAVLERVRREHEAAPHPGVVGARLRLHLAVHAVVESQLEQGEPSETARTLQRLIGEGLERHEAVHAIGSIAADEVVGCLARGEGYDEARYVSALQALSASAWRRSREE